MGLTVLSNAFYKDITLQWTAQASSQMFTVSAKTRQSFDLSRSLCSCRLETVLKSEVWNRYDYFLFFQDGEISLQFSNNMPKGCPPL